MSRLELKSRPPLNPGLLPMLILAPFKPAFLCGPHGFLKDRATRYPKPWWLGSQKARWSRRSLLMSHSYQEKKKERKVQDCFAGIDNAGTLEDSEKGMSLPSSSQVRTLANQGQFLINQHASLHVNSANLRATSF